MQEDEPFTTPPGRVPSAWKLILAQAFADAEAHGLGTWAPSFQAADGMYDQAADFIDARCDYLSKRL